MKQVLHKLDAPPVNQPRMSTHTDYSRATDDEHLNILAISEAWHEYLKLAFVFRKTTEFQERCRHHNV